MSRLPRIVAAAAVLAAAVPAQSTTYPSLVYATVQVGGSPHDLLLELVVPDGAGPWPVVVWVHGGGWTGGSRLPIPAAATRLVPRGYAVASIDYRLSGQAIWPAQIHDCKAAIRYLRANAALWGLDPDRIGAMGSSAGGHLVGALGTMGGVGEVRAGSFVVDLEGSVGPHAGTSSRVQAVVDQFGPMNMLFANDFPTFDHDGATSPESRLIGGALQANPEKWATVDPISFLSPDDPPILAMHGTDDTAVPFHQSELLVAAGRAIGHDTALFPVQDNGHGGPGFLAADATAAIDAFFDGNLRDLPDVRVAITATDALAAENGDTATFTVTRTGSVAAPLVIALSVGGDADAADGGPVPALVTIPAGQTSTSVTFAPQQDTLVEGSEDVVVHIVSSRAYRIDHTAGSAAAELADDDSAVGLPVVSVNAPDAAATEAPGNPGTMRFVRSGSTAAALTVSYTIAGTAANGADYTALSGTAVIPAGSVGVNVAVTTLQDQQREPGETVVLAVASASHYARGVARSAHVVIADDDRSSPLPVVGVLGTDRTFAETGDAGAFTVTRTGATAAPLTVRLGFGGTATPGFDHMALPAMVTIPAGAAWVRVPATPIDDAAVEGPENVVATIAPSAAYMLGAAATQQLRLADDEAPPPAPSPVSMRVTPLAVGRVGFVSLTGGAPGGIASVWIGLAPGYLPLPPFGTVQVDPAQAGPFTAGVFDAEGNAALPISVPPTTSLAGVVAWWQGIAGVPAAPFLVLTDAAERTLLGPPPF